MKIEGTQKLHALREKVYTALTDPKILQRCIPGCESLEKTADDTYAAVLKAGIGSIKGRFKGEVRLEDMRPPNHYRIVVEGKGAWALQKDRPTSSWKRRTARRRSSIPASYRLVGRLPASVSA